MGGEKRMLALVRKHEGMRSVERPRLRWGRYCTEYYWSGCGLVTLAHEGSGGQGNEILGFIKYGEFIEEVLASQEERCCIQLVIICLVLIYFSRQIFM